jgi:hypothetical protein
VNQDDQDYAGLLKALREDKSTDTGTEGISIDRAVQDGRRTVRRRRVIGGLAVVALIAAASTSPLLLNAIRDRDNGQPVGPAPGTAQPFSIWSQAFEAGSAGGFTPSVYTTGKSSQQIRMRPASEAVGDSTAGVTMVAPGFEPGAGEDTGSGSGTIGWTTETQIDDIDGRPAYRLYQAKDTVTIAWQYADDSWGYAWVAGPAAQEDRARHIAESVHRGIGRPVTVPFTVGRSAVGPDLQVASVSTPFGTNSAGVPAEYLLGLAPETGNEETDAPASSAGLSDRLTVGISKPPPGIAQTTTIAGRPAEVHDEFTRITLSQGYIAIASRGPLSSYSADFTAIAASVKLSAGTMDPIR